MTIQVGFCQPENGELIDAEDFLELNEFFAFAEQLSNVVAHCREIDDPVVSAMVAPFFSMLANDAENGEQRFSSFCDDAALYENTRVTPDSGDFDADAATFLGSLVLSEKPISPEKARGMLPFVGAFCGLLDAYVKEARRSRPRAVKAFAFAYDRMKKLAAYCDEAVAQGKSFRFSI